MHTANRDGISSDARTLARALLRRPAIAIERGAFRVEPFGLALLCGGERRSVLPHDRIIERTTTKGLVLRAPVSWPTLHRPMVAAILTHLENMAGTTRRWFTPPWSASSTRIVYHDMASGERPVDAYIDTMSDFTVFDPLTSMILDATFANRTPKGEPRNWQAEARAMLRRDVPSTTQPLQ